MSEFVIPLIRQHYTRASISTFKSRYGLPSILVVFVGTFLYQAVALWRKYRNNTDIIRHRWLRILLGAFLPRAIGYTMLFFLVHNAFVLFALFINKLSAHGTTDKAYVIHFGMDSTRSKASMFLSDIGSKEYARDEVLKDYVYNAQLKNLDTVHVIYKTGLLGIPFPDINHTKK